MNETWSGLASDGNLESVDVACSWLGGRDAQRVADETAYFSDLWQNTYPGPRRASLPPTSLVRRSLPQPMPTGKARSSASCVNGPRPTTDPPTPRVGRSSPSRQLVSQRGAPTIDAGSWRSRRAPARRSPRSRPSVRRCGNTARRRLCWYPTRPYLHSGTPNSAPPARRSTRRFSAPAPATASGAACCAIGPTAEAGRHLVLATVQTARSHRFRSELARGQHLLLVARRGPPARLTIQPRALG